LQLASEYGHEKIVQSLLEIQTHMRKKKKKNTPMGSDESSEHELMVTLCHVCDPKDKIRSAFESEGVLFHINKRMIETWYVYLALTRLVSGSILVKDHGNGTVQLINRGEFMHTENAQGC
jgi:hypothetical protein